MKSFIISILYGARSLTSRRQKPYFIFAHIGDEKYDYNGAARFMLRLGSYSLRIGPNDNELCLWGKMKPFS